MKKKKVYMILGSVVTTMSWAFCGVSGVAALFTLMIWKEAFWRDAANFEFYPPLDVGISFIVGFIVWGIFGAVGTHALSRASDPDFKEDTKYFRNYFLFFVAVFLCLCAIIYSVFV